MKNLLLVVLMCFACSAFGQSYIKGEFPEVWSRASEYTMEVARAMPAELYNYKPYEDAMTFRQQMEHLVNNIGFLSSKITGEKLPLDVLEVERTKDEILKSLAMSFQNVDRLIAEIDIANLKEEITFARTTMSRENLFYLIRNHMAHHRGQAILYLRMNDIAAPKYVGW